MEILNDLNYQLGNLIGLTLFDPQHFISLVMRFILVIWLARKFAK